MVDPAKKECDPDDPMEFNGVALPGNSMEAMAGCFVEEFIMMGYTDEQLLKMFRDPFYVAVNMVYKEKGEAFVTALIQQARSKLGTFRFRVH